MNGYALLEPNGCLEYFLRIQTIANMAGLFMKKNISVLEKKGGRSIAPYKALWGSRTKGIPIVA